MSHPSIDVNTVFRRLGEKYAVEIPKPWTLQKQFDKSADKLPSSAKAAALTPGWTLLGETSRQNATPLMPWRCERRFVELKRLLDERTVTPPVLCRFSCQTTGRPMSLDAVLYREFDLLEWLIGSPIASVHASIAADRFANVLVCLKNGIIASIEAGTTLPPNAKPAIIDRHEIIAGRGVISDRVVDTQIPQESVYTFTERGANAYTDTDAELFGLDADEINLVRAAYALAQHPEHAGAMQKQHERLIRLIALARKSDTVRQRLSTEGAQQ